MIKDFELFTKDRGISSGKLDSYEKYLGQYIEPTVVEERRMNATQLSVFSRLFMDRILFLGTEINSDVANIINSQLLYLQSEDTTKPIKMYINSPGGSVYDGMSIYDVMNFISCPVETTCIGTAASMAAVILSSGEEGKRFALPHSQIMIHEPMGGVAPRTRSTDFAIEAEQMKKCKTMLTSILSLNCGIPYEEMEEECKHDKWFTPNECIPGVYGTKGLIDKVIKTKK